MTARKTVNFKSKAAYERWLSYGHANGLFTGKGENITIRGKKHKVVHEKK
jgi:hypothetical protein